MMTGRRGFMSAIVAAIAWPWRRGGFKSSWMDAEKFIPEVHPMRLYAVGQIVLRSVNVLCENDSQVFLGFVVVERDGKRSWYTSGDHHGQFRMRVERWSRVDTLERKLHVQWRRAR